MMLEKVIVKVTAGISIIRLSGKRCAQQIAVMSFVSLLVQILSQELRRETFVLNIAQNIKKQILRILTEYPHRLKSMESTITR